MSNNKVIAVRGVPEDLKGRFKLLKAQRIIKSGEDVSLNALYIRALEDYANREESKVAKV